MQRKRLDELEGLRGIAAVVVAVHHFLLLFWGVAFLGVGAGFVQYMRLEDNLYGNPLMVLLSGPFAVAVFFVLSGFVLSIGFFQTGKIEIVQKLAAKRYLRLMLPALASVMLCFVIIGLGVSRIHEVAEITSANWLAERWAFQPDFFAAMKSGIYDIFVQSGNPYNSVLWTMMYEFAGSFLVFGFLALCGKLKYRWVLYVVLGIVTFNTWFFAFIVGMAMADLYALGIIQSKRRRLRLAIPFLGAMLFLGGYPYGAGVEGTAYQYIAAIGGSTNWSMLSFTVGAAGIILALLMVEQFAKPMRSKYVAGLGKYTFSIYLVHLAVLYTFGVGLFLLFRNTFGIGFNAAALLAVAASLPVVAGLSYLFERYIDAPSIRLSSYVGNVFLEKIPVSDVTHRARRAYRRVMKPFRPKRSAEDITGMAGEEADAAS